MTGIYSPGPYQLSSEPNLTVSDATRIEEWGGPGLSAEGTPAHHAEHQALAAIYARRNGAADHPVIFRANWYWMPASDFWVHGNKWVQLDS